MSKASKSLKNFSIFVLVLILSVGVLPGVSRAERVVVDYGYTKTMGDSGYDEGTSVAVDQDGNVYITGCFSDTVDFDTGEGVDEHTSNGLTSIFLTKINADGSYGWTKTMGGIDGAFGSSVSTDQDNNIYLTGNFADTVDFDPGVGTDEHISNGSRDLFITKINSDGSYGYTKTMGGTSFEYGTSISVDQDENIYTTGVFSNTVDFDPGIGTDEHTSAGGYDIFLTKINANGSYGYTKIIGSAGADSTNSIDTDQEGNVYIVGNFINTVDFDPGIGTDEHTSAGEADIFDVFLTKINADGSYGWTKTMGGIGNDSLDSVSTDIDGNIYITGTFQDIVDFDTSGATDNHTSNGSGDIFLTKINSDGSYEWTKTMGGIYSDWGQAIVIDFNDNIYITGGYEGAVDFDFSDSVDLHTCPGGGGIDCIYLTIVNTDGSYGYTKTINGDLYDYSSSIVTDLSKNIFLFGQIFSTSVDFDPSDAEDIHTSDGSGDIFLTKFSQSIYHHIDPLSGTLVAETAEGDSVDDEEVDDGILEDETETVRVKDDTLPLADISTTFSADLDWSSITGASDTTNYKSFVHNLTSVDGADDTFTLYVPHRRGDTSVVVCPGATSLEIVTDSCENVVTYREGVSDVSVVTINDTNFWSIPNQTGTGGISIPPVRMTSGSRPKSSIVAFVSPVIPSTSSGQVTPEVQTCTLTLLLKQNSKGEEVKCLQTKLNESLKLSLDTDGMFGPKTKASVILFQKAHGLVPDGVVGPKTRGEMNK
jgi:hypothetical protein